MWCVDIATVFAFLLGARFMGGIFRGTCRAAAAAAAVADAWVVERVGGDMIQCHTHLRNNLIVSFPKQRYAVAVPW